MTGRRERRGSGGRGDEGEDEAGRKRLLLILPTTTYRTEAFVEAALRLDVALTVSSERDSAFSAQEPERLLTLDLARPERALRQAQRFAAATPVHGAFGVDDATALVAAMVNDALGVPTSPVHAVRAAGDKQRQREVLARAGVPVPAFTVHHMEEPVDRVAASTAFPCVLKPLDLAASRGVIRADDPEGFRAAHRRLRRILEAAGRQRTHGAPPRFLVEAYVPGPEFALEGLVRDGALHVLALFDKPDPLEGPFFEETIYVTPSRVPAEQQRALMRAAQDAVRALGLTRGPAHVELRHNRRGPWLIELAARPIGGKCGRVLRFGPGGEISLEELHLAHALDLRHDVPPLAPGAHGVMMLPIPRAGVLREVRGTDRALAVPGIIGVEITMHRGQRVVPLPEEARYLGFVFARAGEPEAVEAALRAAYDELEIVIE